MEQPTDRMLDPLGPLRQRAYFQGTTFVDNGK